MAIHIRRRGFILTLGGAVAWPFAARATARASYLNATDFASRLDRAIDRSERAKVIEGHAIRDENCG